MDYTQYLGPGGYPGDFANGTWDGGDTAAIMGTIMATSNAMTAKIILPLKQEVPFDYIAKQPLRNPDATKWWGLPNRFSRDQLIPMICGLIGFGITSDDLYEAHKARWFMTAWNTVNNDGTAKTFPSNLGDICGPEVWALWIRYFKPWWGWGVLWFLDVQTLIGAIQWRWLTSETNQITRNHMLVCLTMEAVMPSPLTYVINWINNWPDLIARWRASNAATGEFPSADLIQNLYTTGKR